MTWVWDTPRLRAVNEEGTLYETPSREIWQCQVLTSDGVCIGYAIRQIIEPRACSVRYLIVYNSSSGRRLLLPAVFVSGADEGTILCSVTSDEAAHLVEYDERLDRSIEALSHTHLGYKPYWENEAPDPSSCDH